MERKIRTGLADELARREAIKEAAGIVPPLRERLNENKVAQAQAMMVFDSQMYDPNASQWWADFATMDRVKFERVVDDLVRQDGVFAALRGIAETSGRL
uniref:Uncharacterized protein n=1 Tax=Rhodopseudomonas palustris (strain BisA53) TaxID=316055 RepID=Q07PN5_RHOP5